MRLIYPEVVWLWGLPKHMGNRAIVLWLPKRVHVSLQFKMRIKICIIPSPFLCSLLAPIFWQED